MRVNQIQPLQFRLLQFSRDFMFSFKTGEIVSKYKKDLEVISPLEAMKVFNWMSQSDYDIQTISNKIDKLTSVFYKPLKNESSVFPSGHFLLPYENENSVLLRKMEEVRRLLVDMFKSHDPLLVTQFQNFLNTIKNHSRHFLSVEVHIFPLFERVLPQYAAYVRFEKIFHDEFKQMLREIDYSLSQESCSFEEFNKLVGRLYFRLSLRLYRENLILFPVCAKYIHDRFYQMVLVKSN
jgi:DUF438 domain-containing protein